MRALRKAALATMVAALALAAPAGIAAAAPGPTTTVSQTTGLTAAGQSVTVSGAGFSGGGAGIYVGLAQDDKFSSSDESTWISTVFVKSSAMSGGAWSAPVDVQAVKGSFDCLKNACSIYTVAAHGSSDRSQDTKVPVTFSPSPSTSTPTTTPTTTPPTTTTKPPATSTTTPPMITTSPDPETSTSTPPPASSGARTILSKASGLNAAGETITVTGSGFSGGGAGIYVGLAQNDRFSSSDEASWMSTVFIKSSQMSAGGWSAAVEVMGAKGGFDCLANKCSIYTVAAHGSSDRSQDTRADVSFTGTAAPGGSDASGGSGGSGGGATGGGASGGGASGGGATGGASGGFTNSNLKISLSKATDLNPGGESVTISGSGFSGAAPGLYVGLVQDDKFSATNADIWMTTAFLKPDQISGGSWSITAELPSVAAGSDCMVNTCSIYTVAAHGSSDRSQDSRTPVGFLGGVAPSTDNSVPGGGAAPAAAGAKALVGAGNSVKVELSKKEGLNADGETIKVTGTGFSGEGAGVYVGVIQDDKFSVTDVTAWITTKYVKSAEMKDGKWTADVEVMAVGAGSDCTKNACSIYTIAAHGSSDRTQDSQTPVTFGPGTGAAAAGSAGSSDAEVRNMANSASTGLGWLGTLLIGGLAGGLVAGGVVAGAFLARRREV